MFAIKSARQWTNTDSPILQGLSRFDLINIHLLIFSRDSPASLSPSPPPPLPPPPPPVTRLLVTRQPSLQNYFIRGRPRICPRVYFALVTRAATLYANPCYITGRFRRSFAFH